MVRHLLQIVAIWAVLAACILYPFLPGPYDSLAVALSTMAQAFGVFGLLPGAVGAVWLGYELWSRRRRAPDLAARPGRSSFAIAAVVAWVAVAVAVSLVGYAVVGFSLGMASLVLWMIGLSRFVRRVRQKPTRENGGFDPTPLYLVLIPIGVLGFQLAVAAPTTQFSRTYAIEHSAAYVADIEAYASQQGRYPTSLVAMWKDYDPSVVGIEQYHYMPEDDTYNLSFEQPRFLFDNIGTREWVVYNPRDRHRMYSHTSWILLLSPPELASNQGWYGMNDTTIPHWKFFWFD